MHSWCLCMQSHVFYQQQKQLTSGNYWSSSHQFITTFTRLFIAEFGRISNTLRSRRWDSEWKWGRGRTTAAIISVSSRRIAHSEHKPTRKHKPRERQQQSVISKILEHLFLLQFQPHILACSNFNKYKSAYWPGCSTETALRLLLDRIYSTADEGRPTLLMSLDMSAAFDTIDHTVLLKRLSCSSSGVVDNVHSWIHSYLTGRTQPPPFHLAASVLWCWSWEKEGRAVEVVPGI